ncbi:hypothetical protein F4780DRAFT_734620 [Xylariomycetidae sp. FL0641]|nr:hypothetical protein F4780DRAFT_734620 [Xylariomycetidae sp. FL0641]
MPRGSLLFDTSTRSFICSSCLRTLRKASPTAPWPVRHASQQVARQTTQRPPQRVASPSARPPSSRLTPDQEAERLKTLETLGLVNEKPKLAVNYFEQQNDGRLRRLKNKDDFSQALTDPGGRIDDTLRNLESRLEQMSGFANSLTGLMGEEEDPEPPKSSVAQGYMIPEDGQNQKTRDRIHALNKRLYYHANLASEDLADTPRNISLLWSKYALARPILSKQWNLVPRPAWDILWQVLGADHRFNTNRMSHIYDLAKDMVLAGESLSSRQQLLAIEAMFIQGARDQAIKNHKRYVTTLGEDPELSRDFWQLGLRMYCLVGDMERAERILTTIKESPYGKDPRAALPFIRMCAQNPSTVERGFQEYRTLRTALQDSITIDDYDLLVSYFLGANQTEHALYIFVDMMTSGVVDLCAVRHYPPSVANPFFFGKWIKKLVLSGDLEGAHNVLLLMRSKGIIPRAIQVNALIGALLRSKTAENTKRAEDIAYAMINTRIQFVDLRRREASNGVYQMKQRGDGWPQANLETFSILAENYKDRSLPKKMEELWDAFREVEIAPNSFMLNQLLMSYIQSGNGARVADLYESFNRRYKIKPHQLLFLTLWQALPINRLNRISPAQMVEEIPAVRALFAHTVRCAPALTEGGVEFNPFLARRILHSFRKVGDGAGLFVAFRALRHFFDYRPPHFVVIELMIGSSDLEKTAKGRSAARVVRAKYQIEHYLNYRHRELSAAGELPEDGEMPEKLVLEETANFLEICLETALSSSEQDDSQPMLSQAAQDMGLDEHGPDGDETQEKQ